jgi:GntR family histidine utilization transcriptional repressor
MAKQSVAAFHGDRQPELDPAAPRPLYQQVKDHVVERIEQGALAPGARISSEHELVRLLGASRMTVNRALRELFAEGVLTRVPGVGTFVATPRNEAELLSVRNVAVEIRERGARYSCKVHEIALTKASPAVASGLELKVGASVFRSVIVHFENDAPVQLEERYVNPAFTLDYLSVDFQKTTPHEYLCQIAPISEVEHVVEAVLPDSRTQKLLNVAAHEPCLRLYRSTWSFGRKVTCVWLTHPGKLYRMVARFAPHRIRATAGR